MIRMDGRGFRLYVCDLCQFVITGLIISAGGNDYCEDCCQSE